MVQSRWMASSISTCSVGARAVAVEVVDVGADGGAQPDACDRASAGLSGRTASMSRRSDSAWSARSSRSRADTPASTLDPAAGAASDAVRVIESNATYEKIAWSWSWDATR